MRPTLNLTYAQFNIAHYPWPYLYKTFNKIMPKRIFAKLPMDIAAHAKHGLGMTDHPIHLHQGKEMLMPHGNPSHHPDGLR